MNKVQEFLNLLPGYNCKICGFQDCRSFAVALIEKKISPDKCPVLLQDRFKGKKEIIFESIRNINHSEKLETIGLIDKVKADFSLYPLPSEPSCRETMVCFSHVDLEKDMIIRYRPLGCPIIHFARIIEINHGLLNVWISGPPKLLGRTENPVDIGICMVLSFQGIIEGKMPKVGQTVKFLPAHCMMGKVHSGVIVELENNKTRIDCIDLKVWQHSMI